jgi:integrase
MSTSTTLTSLFDTFLRLRNLRPGTAEIYGYGLRRLTAAVGDIAPDQVTPLAAMTFAAGLLAGGLKPATANMYLRAVKAFFSWLTAVECLDKNPFKAVKFFRDTAAGKPTYPADAVERLLAVCGDDRWRLIVALAITTGMRRGEILNLTVSEVDYAAGVITLADKTAGPSTWPWQIKDAERRRVPITPFVERLLLRRHAALPSGQSYLCLTPRRVEYLLDLQRSGRLTHTRLKCPEVNFRRSFLRLCRLAGVPYHTFHALRGSALTLMADAGLQPHDLAAIAGHADTRTTFRHYLRPDQAVEKARGLAFHGRYWT